MKIFKFFNDEKKLKTEIEYKGIAKYMPLIVCGGFYLLTILLFAFGPFDWNISNSKDLYLFLSFSLIALIVGYILGATIKRKKKFLNVNVNHIMYLSFAIYIIMYILNCYITTGKLYPDIIRGLFDSGTAYRISHSTLSGLSTYVFYLSIVATPFTSFIMPFLFIYYKSLNLKSKIMGFTVIFLNLAIGIAQGVINSYAVLAFQVIMFLLIYLFSNIKNKSKIKICSIILSILLIGTSFLFYYKIVMSNRLIADTLPENNIVEKNNDKLSDNANKNEINNKKRKHSKNNYSEEEINDMLLSSAQYISQTSIKNNYFYSFLPNSIKDNINHIVSYVTHGYKGLSFALSKNFTSSYGLGFSDFFRHNFLKIIGKSNIENQIYQRTYMYKIMEDGWETGAVWSTFFIFPASDIGFVLTIILVMFIGFIFSLSWRDALESKNIFASVLFINLCMIICFFCANNVYFQNGGSFLTIFFMGICYIITRLKGKEE